MRDNIENILTQLKAAGYIKNVEFYKNHFYYRICNLDTQEQKKMIEDKMNAFIDETEWNIIKKFSNEYIIYNYSIIENILDEPNYEKATNDYSFMEVIGKIGDSNKITLYTKDNCRASRDILYDIEKKLGENEDRWSEILKPLDSRISYLSAGSWGKGYRIIITTFNGDEFAENKTWCKIENTKNELDKIFDI